MRRFLKGRGVVNYMQMSSLLNKKLKFSLWVSVFALIPVFSFAQTATTSQTTTPPQALLYVTSSTRGIESLRMHVAPTDIVAPQTYATTPKGKLLGKPNTQILEIAASVGASVMPLVSNQNFNQKGIDAFLHNTTAQDALLNALVTEAQNRKYIGYQYDFEHIPVADRDLYSAFVAKSAPIFHAAGLKLSVAVAPIHSENPSDLPLASWNNWTGAFDYTAIGVAADFVSVMAYDDALSLGPTASLPWVTKVATYTLAHIPANKVSFGIPFYAWVKSNTTGKRVNIVGYPALASILDKGLYLNKGFSDALGVPWVTYKTKSGKIVTAWYEDSQSFAEKMALVTSDHMAGYSVWALGLEDPHVWDSRTTTAGVALR